jgi:hypothetical protein
MVDPDGNWTAAKTPAMTASESTARSAGYLVHDFTVRPTCSLIERVVFTIEPAGNPRGTATGTLQELEEHKFTGRIGLRVPAFIDEVYTVRVFAVDDDSLASNQALGHVRFIPDS